MPPSSQSFKPWTLFSQTRFRCFLPRHSAGRKKRRDVKVSPLTALHVYVLQGHHYSNKVRNNVRQVHVDSDAVKGSSHKVVISQQIDMTEHTDMYIVYVYEHDNNLFVMILS